MLRNAEQFLYGDEDRPDDYAAEYEMYMEDDEEGGQDGLDMIIVCLYFTYFILT